MLMKAFNRGFFFDDDRRTFRGKQTFTKLSNINIHYEAFSRMNFLRKKEETNFKFPRPNKSRHCLYIKTEKNVTKNIFK